MKWLKAWMGILCLFAVMVFVLEYTVATTPTASPSLLHLVILIFFIYMLFKAFELPGVKPTFKVVGKGLKGLAVPLKWLFEVFPNSSTGSRWARWYETHSMLNPSNTGFVINGNKKRLNNKQSYQNILVASQVGAGKTSVLQLPNIYRLADTGSSMVITDVKPAHGDPGMGELYSLTSGYLARRGYRIRVLNLADPLRSLCWNPLANLSPEPFKAFNEVQSIANIAINNTAPGQQNSSRDPHWNNSAIKHMIMFTNALRALADQEARFRPYVHLSGVRDLFNQCRVYSDPRQPNLPIVTEFMLRVGMTNPQLSQDYLTALANNANSISGEMGTAITALANLANPAIANILGSNNFRFEELRERKTALFFTVPIQHLAQQTYSFIVRIFFNQLLDHLRRSQSTHQRSVMLLLDEVGNFTIDGLADFIGTSRSFNVGTLAILQSLSQLPMRYGHDQAIAIRENLSTQCCFGGTSGETAEYFSKIMGKTRYKSRQSNQTYSTHREDLVVSASEISNTEKKYLFCKNVDNYPMKFKVTPYYKHPQFKRYAKIPPIPIPETTPPPVSYLDLNQFRTPPVAAPTPNVIATP